MVCSDFGTAFTSQTIASLSLTSLRPSGSLIGRREAAPPTVAPGVDDQSGTEVRVADLAGVAQGAVRIERAITIC